VVSVPRGAVLCVLLLLAAHRRLPLQPEGWGGADVGLSVPREGSAGGAHRPPAARHHKVGVLVVFGGTGRLGYGADPCALYLGFSSPPTPPLQDTSHN